MGLAALYIGCFVPRISSWGFPGGSRGKEPACQYRRCEFDPWVGKIPWRREWQPTPVFLPGESHGQRSLAGYSPCGHKAVDTFEETLHTYTGCLLPPRLPRRHGSSPAPEARGPTHSWPFVLGSWPPGRGHIEFSPHVPCDLSSLETFCRLIFCWAERERHGHTEGKERGNICGRKKKNTERKRSKETAQD